MFQSHLTQSDALRLELKVQDITQEMADNGFPLDVDECNKQIAQLKERVDWVEEHAVPCIPQKIKKKGTTVEKIYLLSGAYTKQVRDWLGEVERECADSHAFSAVAGRSTCSIGDRVCSFPTVPDVMASFDRLEYHPINLGSDKQVKEWLLSIGWIPLEWNYKKVNGKEIRDAFGNKVKTSPKITEESLDQLDDLGPVAKLIGYRRKMQHKRSQMEGFLRNMRPDGCVPSKVNPLGTATRRMSHSVIANVPSPKKGALWKDMRKVFCAPDGHKVVGCDASQIQIRGLAHYATYFGDTTLRDILYAADRGEGPDVHEANGERADVTRNESKGIFYGYLFGAGIPKTAAQLGKSVEYTEKVRKKFDAAVPFVSKIVKALEKFYRKHGYILGIAGNKIYTDSPHMLLVYLLQDYEQFIMKVALCKAYEDIKKHGYDAKIATMQHDEFQFIVKEEHAQPVAKILEDSIEWAGTFAGSKCLNKGEAEIGNTWYDTH